MNDSLMWFIDAFNSLSTKRGYTIFGQPLPISFSEINAYLNLFPTKDIDVFVHHMDVLDTMYIDSKTESKEVTLNGSKETNT